MMNDRNNSAGGALVFSVADATNPPFASPMTPTQPNNDTRKATIQVPASAAASDETLVADLTRLVNNVFCEHENTIFRTAFERTSTSDIEAYLRAGELAVAFLQSNDDEANFRSNVAVASTAKPVGCVSIKKLSPTTGEFGMLAVDPRYRGTGLGRDLIRFAEERCRRDFALATMRLELLVPMHFEHAGKSRVQAWYMRLGYVMTGLRDFGEAYPVLNALLAGPTEYRIFEKQLVA